MQKESMETLDPQCMRFHAVYKSVVGGDVSVLVDLTRPALDLYEKETNVQLSYKDQ